MPLQSVLIDVIISRRSNYGENRTKKERKKKGFLARLAPGGPADDGRLVKLQNYCTTSHWPEEETAEKEEEERL